MILPMVERAPEEHRPRATTSRRARVAAGLGAALLALAAGALVARSARDAEITSIEGGTLPYRLALPATGWRLRDRDEARLEAPEADAWAERPDVPADLIVVTELGADPEQRSLDDLEDRAIVELELAAERVAVLEREELARGRMIVLSGQTPDGEVRAVIGLFLVPGVAYRVVLTVGAPGFSAIDGELRDIVRSFDPGQ